MDYSLLLIICRREKNRDIENADRGYSMLLKKDEHGGSSVEIEEVKSNNNLLELPKGSFK